MKKSPLDTSEATIAEKPTHALIEVTDVGDGPQEFDAISTISARHLVRLSDHIFHAPSPAHLKYAADFASELPEMARERICRAKAAASANNRDVPHDVREAENTWDTTTLRWVNNCNPRDQKVQDGHNGHEPHLAFVNGVEIYAVPAVSFQYLRARGKIDALFRIPPVGHPLFPQGEQFTSSVFGKTAHEAPEHLQVAWRKGDPESTLDAIIPPLQGMEVAFRDRPFGNRRIITPRLPYTLEELDRAASSTDQSIVVQIGTTRLRVFLATSLSQVPEGEWGIWCNPADASTQNGAAYLELSRRWQPGQRWDDRGQFPDLYLAPQDRLPGVPVSILPKNAKLRWRDQWRQFIAKYRKLS